MALSLKLFLASLLLACSDTAALGTVYYFINNRADLSMYRDALISLGIFFDLMDNPKFNVTVLAPTNDVLSKDPSFVLFGRGQQFNPPTWDKNLDAIIRNTVIPNATLTSAEIFNQTRLQSLYGLLTVDTFFNKVEQASIVEPDKVASNGIVQIMDRLVAPAFEYQSFKELELQPEFGPDELGRTALVDVVDFVGARDEYTRVVERGLTHAGCRIRAFNRINDYQKWTINVGNASGLIEAEFLNESMKNETIHNFIQYSLIPKNYYYDNLPDGYEDMIMPVPNCAHMFVTKYGGKLCFNNACTINTPDLRTYLASNGVGYVVDKCLVCPGISMLVEYASEFTKNNMKDVAQMFISSEWNRRNLSLDVGDGTPVTLFAAINTGWFEVNGEDTVRLSTDKWKPHQWDLLRHMLIQGNWTVQMLQDKLVENKGPYNLTSLAGQNLTVKYDSERDKLMVAGGDVFYPNVVGVDGICHFVTKVPLPVSMTHTVYEIARFYGGYAEQINLIDTVFLREDMNRLSPLTAMYAPDAQWQNKLIELTDISTAVLENMIFKDLLWCHVLVGLAGTEVESHNGQFWLISVNADGFPCFDVWTESGPGRSCVTKCDILARNGIVHELDTIMLFEKLETRGPSPPVPPTFVPPTLPQRSNTRPSAIKPSVVAEYGPLSPVAFSKPKALYDLDQLDQEGPPSGARPLALLLGLLAAAIPCIVML